MPDVQSPAGLRESYLLFSDAEGAEDQIENVVGGSLPCQGIESPEGSVKVEQDHLMGDAAVVGMTAVFEGGSCVDNGLLLAKVCEETGFGGGSAGGELEDFLAERVDASAL